MNFKCKFLWYFIYSHINESSFQISNAPLAMFIMILVKNTAHLAQRKTITLISKSNKALADGAL